MSNVPFDPNGMIMDLLKSCYRSQISFVAGDPTVQATATWYFAAPGAIPFPGPHAFGSSVWDSVHPTITTLGWDATKPRRYYNGRRLNSSSGQSFAGPAEYFLTGAPAPALLPRGTNGTPVECLSPPFGLAKGGLCVPVRLAAGGVVLGGTAKSGITPGSPCSACVGITPATVVVSLSGFSGAFAGFNGVWSLAQTSPCVWVFQFSPGVLIEMQRLGPDEWFLSTFDGTSSAAWSAHTPDCITPTTLALVFSTMGGASTQSLSF